MNKTVDRLRPVPASATGTMRTTVKLSKAYSAGARPKRVPNRATSKRNRKTTKKLNNGS